MATQLVLVQSLGVRVLPPEQEAVSTTVATMTAAQVLPISGSPVPERFRPRSSRGLGRQVLNLVARVRIPYGVPRGPVRYRAGSGAFRAGPCRLGFFGDLSSACRPRAQLRCRRWPVSLTDRNVRMPVDEAVTRIIPQ